MIEPKIHTLVRIIKVSFTRDIEYSVAHWKMGDDSEVYIRLTRESFSDMLFTNLPSFLDIGDDEILGHSYDEMIETLYDKCEMFIQTGEDK